VEAKLIHADRRAGGRRDMMKLIDAFRQYANACKHILFVNVTLCVATEIKICTDGKNNFIYEHKNCQFSLYLTGEEWLFTCRS
jgi:hypothetical protein